MSPDILKLELDKKFKVLEFVDLSVIMHQPSAGFAVFKERYKEIFEPHERIVFYTSQAVGSKTLAFLQYAADLFDISRCFVLICGPQFNAVVTPHDVEFMLVDVDAEPFDDNAVISVSSLCAMPWLHTEYMNVAKICCLNTDYARDTTVVEFFNSDQVKQLRQQLRTGERPASCDHCWSAEAKGFSSMRQWRNQIHKQEFFTQYLDQPTLKSLVVCPSTVCNFKCRSCSAYHSSQWAQEELVHAQDEQQKQKLREIISFSQWFDDKRSQEIFELWPTLDNIDIYGGEPFMIKQFKQLLELSIESGVAKKQRLHFNTNGSWFPSDIIALMREFKEVAISLSIDDIGERFEIIRGGTWSEVNANVDRFLSCDPTVFKVSGHVTVSNLNVLYLDELLTWAHGKNLPLSLQMLNHPAYLCYDSVTEPVRQLIVQKYQNHNNQTLRNIAQSLDQAAPVDGVEWVSKMTELDLRRNQNMLTSHPELAAGMGYTQLLG